MSCIPKYSGNILCLIKKSKKADAIKLAMGPAKTSIISDSWEMASMFFIFILPPKGIISNSSINKPRLFADTKCQIHAIREPS